MLTRIRRNDPIELRAEMRVVLSYDPESRGTIKTLGGEVSSIHLENGQWRFICNELLKPEMERVRVRR